MLKRREIKLVFFETLLVSLILFAKERKCKKGITLTEIVLFGIYLLVIDDNNAEIHILFK